MALDLGCGAGSLSYAHACCCIVAVDLRAPPAIPNPRQGGFVRADAARLPLPDACCDLVIANHTLEHVCNWRAALREAGRILKPEGILVLSVPDGYCLSDALFRFLDNGREHVNRFRREQLVTAVVREGGLRPRRYRLLYSSYSFLNRQPGQRLGGRAQVLNWAPPRFLRGALMAWNAMARAADRHLGTRWSIYGWLFIFSRQSCREVSEDPAEPNVCIRCGSSHDAAWLRGLERVRGQLLPRYNCPTCGALNLFFSR